MTSYRHQQLLALVIALALLWTPSPILAANSQPLEFIEENPYFIYSDVTCDSVYHDGKYYGVVPVSYSDGTFGEVVLVSNDQKQWTLLSQLQERGDTIPNAKKMRYLNNRWLISLGDQKGEIVYSSLDGLTWKALELHYADITYYNNEYWAIDSEGTIFYSKELDVWSRLTQLESIPLLSLKPVDLCVSKDAIVVSHYNPKWGKDNAKNGLEVYDLHQSAWKIAEGYEGRIGATLEIFWTGAAYVLAYQNDYVLGNILFYTSTNGQVWTLEKNSTKLLRLIADLEVNDSNVLGLTKLLKNQISNDANRGVAIPVQVMLDNQIVNFDGDAVLKNGRVLVPVRKIFEVLGGSMTWSSETQTVTGLVGDVSIKMTIGSSIAAFNNLPIPLDVPAQIIGGRTYVPVRFIADSLGKKVEWDGDRYIVKINNK